MVSVLVLVTSCMWITVTTNDLDRKAQNTDYKDHLYIALLLFLACHTTIFTLISYYWVNDIEIFIQMMIMNSDFTEPSSPSTNEPINVSPNMLI